jgi:hypothetical protein
MGRHRATLGRALADISKEVNAFANASISMIVGLYAEETCIKDKDASLAVVFNEMKKILESQVLGMKQHDCGISYRAYDALEAGCRKSRKLIPQCSGQVRTR